MTRNYALFGKNLEKIAAGTVAKFGSMAGIVMFLQEVCNSGNVALAARNLATKNATDISPIDLHKIIKGDRYLSKCVNLALSYATLAAEGVLYDRAMNGYEELSYNKDGECTGKKKKYCPRSLLEYLKANCPKYRTAALKKEGKRAAKKIEIISYEVESYEQKRA